MRPTLCIGLVLVTMACGVSADASFTIVVLGAWNRADGDIKIDLDLIDVTYQQQVPLAIERWKNAVDLHADQTGLVQLKMLDFLRYQRYDPGICVPDPPVGGRQALYLSDLDATVCLTRPDPNNLPDIVISHASIAPPVVGSLQPLGVTYNIANQALWVIRTQDPPVSATGEYIRPILVVLGERGNDFPPLPLEPQVKHNVALHEFGHAIALDHTQPGLDDDLMDIELSENPITYCFSNLDMRGIEEAYGWLGSQFITPDPWAEVSQYVLPSANRCPA